MDRRSLCYRCGQDGHQAKNCENIPQYVICREAGRPSAHRIGGASCKAPSRRTGDKAKREGVKSGTSSSSTSSMEVEMDRPSVRGGSAPFPGRPVQTGKDKVEQMKTEQMSPPPKEQRTPRTWKGAEEPDNKVQNSPHQE